MKVLSSGHHQSDNPSFSTPLSPDTTIGKESLNTVILIVNKLNTSINTPLGSLEVTTSGNNNTQNLYLSFPLIAATSCSSTLNPQNAKLPRQPPLLEEKTKSNDSSNTSLSPASSPTSITIDTSSSGGPTYSHPPTIEFYTINTDGMSLLGTKSQHDISDKQSSIIRGYPRSILLKPTSGGSPESVHGKFTAEPMVTSCSNGPIVVPLQTLVPIHNMHWGAARSPPMELPLFPSPPPSHLEQLLLQIHNHSQNQILPCPTFLNNMEGPPFLFRALSPSTNIPQTPMEPLTTHSPSNQSQHPHPLHQSPKSPLLPSMSTFLVPPYPIRISTVEQLSEHKKDESYYTTSDRVCRNKRHYKR